MPENKNPSAEKRNLIPFANCLALRAECCAGAARYSRLGILAIRLNAPSPTRSRSWFSMESGGMNSSVFHLPQKY